MSLILFIFTKTKTKNYDDNCILYKTNKPTTQRASN